MRRCLVLTALVLAVLAPAALAQGGSSPFGPLPQAAPAPTPTPTAAPNASQDPISRTTLLLIAAGVAAVFVGLGVAVTRDARKNLTEDDRRALEREESGANAGRTAKQRDAAKAKARQKAKAARAARKRTTRNR